MVKSFYQMVGSVGGGSNLGKVTGSFWEVDIWMDIWRKRSQPWEEQSRQKAQQMQQTLCFKAIRTRLVSLAAKCPRGEQWCGGREWEVSSSQRQQWGPDTAGACVPCEKVGPPKKWHSEISYSHTRAFSVSSNWSALPFGVPSSFCSHSFCSRSGNHGYASLDASVSPDFKVMFALWPQFSDGSKEKLDFSVCSVYFCCKDRCDI